MSMTIRQLPPEEFHRLPIMLDSSALCVVVEDTETKEIKGYWTAQLMVHTEPIWLAPELRGGKELLGIKLYAALLAAMSQSGVTDFYSFADRPEIGDYLERLGFKLTPYITYVNKVPPMEFK